MPAARQKSKANPALLEWARESARLELDAAAAKIGVSEEALRAWEAGDEAPSIPQLRKVADAYKRPLVVFFLPAPPKDFEVLKDFRRLPEDVPVESPSLAAEIRWAYEMREVAVEAMTLAAGEPLPFTFKAKRDQDPVEIGRALRKFLGISVAEIAKCQDHYAAYRLWRAGLDEQGVLSFQISKVAVDEARGFSIDLRPLPVVAVNAGDAVQARIFTLLHETAHLALGGGSTCDLHEKGSRTQDEIEVWCNAVAAEVLVPRDELRAEPDVRNVRQPIEWEEATLRALSNRYRVSREVVVRRFLELGLATQAFYKKKRAEYASEPGRASDAGGGDYYNNFRAKYGLPVIRAVLTAYEAGRLTANEAAAYLRVKVTTLGKLVPS